MKEEKLNEIYDDLAKDCGEVVNETDVRFINKEVGEMKIDELITKGANESVSFAYSSPYDLEPGKPIGDKIDFKASSSKEEGLEFLVEKTAKLKALRERDELNKRKKEQNSREEYEARKKEYIERMMYLQGEAFFTEHHYLMDGKTRRRLKRSLERQYDKGKFKSSGVDLNN